MYERKATFYGTCREDSDGEWHFDDKKITTTALHRRVLYAPDDDDAVVGVITEYVEVWGWCLSGKDFAGDEKEIHFENFVHDKVYLITDQ